MKLTDALLGEHGAFYTLFDQIEEIASMEGTMSQILGATTVLGAMVDSHATLEEKILFSALEPHLGKDEELLAELGNEHREMALLLTRIEDAADVDQAVHLVEDALSSARSHFLKEERLLFPMARSLLDEETLTRLGKQWAEARRVAID